MKNSDKKMEDIYISYIEKKYNRNILFDKVFKEEYLKLSLNEYLERTYFEKLNSLFHENNRNGSFVHEIEFFNNYVDVVMFEFRCNEILKYNIHKKEFFFNEENFKKCMFREDDFNIMKHFINNCLLHKNDLPVELESYSVY